MKGEIPRAFIDDLLGRVDIVEIIDRRVGLKKMGKNHGARCPFHDEKTPSFTVTEQKQFYYCFGCGAGGNAINFIMEYERLGFPQAVKMLAEGVGLDFNELPEDEPGDYYRKPYLSGQLREQYNTDQMVVEIYNSDVQRGRRISLTDKRRYRLAVARAEGVRQKYMV